MRPRFWNRASSFSNPAPPLRLSSFYLRFSTTTTTTTSESFVPPKRRKRRISFITDIEGDALYFDRFVNNSQILEFEERKPNLSTDDHDEEYFPYSHHVIFSPSSGTNNHDGNTEGDDYDDSVLVCGGDVWDKGGSDLYVIRQLLSLQQRYGSDRVHFVLGNRDINKMRILEEIGLPNSSQQTIPPHAGIFFFKGRGLRGDPDSIQAYHKFFPNEKENENPQSDAELMDDPDLYQELSSKLVPSQNAADRLKWILKATMGSPDAFELRRRELIQEAKDQNKDTNITDEQVVQSYRMSCHPVYGEMGRYLQKGKLALKLGNAMFLHGALPLTAQYLEQNRDYKRGGDVFSSGSFYSHAMPWLPPNKNKKNAIRSAEDWINSLNEFCQSKAQQYKANILYKEKRDQQRDGEDVWISHGGYEFDSTNDNDDGMGTNTNDHRTFVSLLQYGKGWLPSRIKNPTVVYASWLQDGMPVRFMDSKNSTTRDENQIFCELVDDFFQINQLQLIVTGHQPNGDMPIPIQVPRFTNDMSDSPKKQQSPRFIVCCDTSYSGDTHWVIDSEDSNNNDITMTQNHRKNLGRGTSLSGRGDVAVSEVLIEQCCENGAVLSLKTHGVLSDGSSYESVDFMDETDSDVEKYVGKLVNMNNTELAFEGSAILSDEDYQDEEERNWWVKSKLIDGSFLVSSGKGYDLWNSVAMKKRKLPADP